MTLRPLRGDLHDAENLSLLLGLLGVLVAESIFRFTTVGDSFSQHAIFWPFALTLMAVVLAARSLAEYATRPLVAWALLFSLLFFSAEMIGWASNAALPNPSFSWGVIATVLALFARWVGRPGLRRRDRQPAQRRDLTVHLPCLVARVRRGG